MYHRTSFDKNVHIDSVNNVKFLTVGDDGQLRIGLNDDPDSGEPLFAFTCVLVGPQGRRETIMAVFDGDRELRRASFKSAASWYIGDIVPDLNEDDLRFLHEAVNRFVKEGRG